MRWQADHDCKLAIAYSKFPKDFMFELSQGEFDNLRSQIVISSWGGTRYKPMAFTEQGIAMLSSILSSERAVQGELRIGGHNL